MLIADVLGLSFVAGLEVWLEPYLPWHREYKKRKCREAFNKMLREARKPGKYIDPPDLDRHLEELLKKDIASGAITLKCEN